MGITSQRTIIRLIRKVNIFLLLPVFCFLLFSCHSDSLFDQYQSIENSLWEKEKEYSFSFKVEDIHIPYDLTFRTRNNHLYPYQNLWLFYSEKKPDGTLLLDTIECTLADEFGQWHGQGISVFLQSYPLRQNYLFPDTGVYVFSFRQGMRNNRLNGIQEIGLEVKPRKD